jgi:imidazolonepropionase-like amidohydrolase
MRDGRFAVVGSEGEVRAAAAPDAEAIDVGGRTVIPGFIDAHNHLSVAAFLPDSVDFAVVSATSDIVAYSIDDIPKTRADMTFVRGELAHQRVR